MHQNEAPSGQGRAARQAGKLLFSAATQCDRQQLPATYFGLEPGTTKADVRHCLERWNEGDNGILDLAGRTGSARHRMAGAAPHPACAGFAGDLRAAMGSDVFGM